MICQQIGLKAKSKKEMYRLLASDGQIYLPPLKEANYKYIRGILTGKKKVSLLLLFHTPLVHQKHSVVAYSCASNQTSECKRCHGICQSRNRHCQLPA